MPTSTSSSTSPSAHPSTGPSADSSADPSASPSASPSDLFRHGLGLLARGDMEGWIALFAEDAVAEFPFAPDGYPRRLEGLAALAPYLRGLSDHIAYDAFPYVEIHETGEPGTIVAEMRAEGRVVATGGPFEMAYVAVVTVGDGLIVRYRDYWNPLAIPASLTAAVHG
ncbi:nuclear transport factor 2 family protein [Streptomyces sp. NRRL B-1347]|uniref:nuclear transport factor 2 family protein n=1 Tax=Streptomyces sp. NRRL B-1347 TaxID=1476877 RepID=UPI00099DB75C|nr:nuclear transport factor 2 family protein [Streptomyces sp. NRRL B-1347]